MYDSVDTAEPVCEVDDLAIKHAFLTLSARERKIKSANKLVHL